MLQSARCLLDYSLRYLRVLYIILKDPKNSRKMRSYDRVVTNAVGFEVLEVDPHYTSQRCPKCGRTRKKTGITKRTSMCVTAAVSDQTTIVLEL
ncbi:zinc ribbon domain-containing protein [Bilifractor sp. HCP3S3_D3]|uniref:zinc ribbon domain-containing protein n=1 Tax=Bilifractor sp. HCP3S3_D3 TaxID=3438907 RepID=UPI003F8B746A